MPEFDPGRLRAALAAVPESAWSLPSSYAVTGVHHGYRQVTLARPGYTCPEAAPFAFVLERFAPVREAWLSWIAPGGFIRPHRDAGPWWERWQVPIAAAGAFRGDGDTVPVDGVPFPVEHWNPHAVINDTDRSRIHLVIDRAVRLPLPARPFHLFPVPDDMADLVDRSLHGATPQV